MKSWDKSVSRRSNSEPDRNNSFCDIRKKKEIAESLFLLSYDTSEANYSSLVKVLIFFYCLNYFFYRYFSVHIINDKLIFLTISRNY